MVYLISGTTINVIATVVIIVGDLMLSPLKFASSSLPIYGLIS
jgi:hypothetical protein